MVDKYLETTGECAVNLDSSVVKEVKQAIQNKTLQSDTFQQAKKEAFKLMSEHSLPRFIQSLDLPDFIY